MKIYKCGTKCKIKATGKDVEITAIEIRYNQFAYEVTFWKEDERKTAWLTPREIEISKNETEKIGL